MKLSVELPALSQTVRVRGLKVKEIDKLTDKKQMVSGEALNSILSDCLLTEGVDTMKMLNCDRNELFMAIRRATFGDDIDVVVSCPFCAENAQNAKQEFTIDLSKLEKKPGNKDLLKQAVADPAHSFPFTLPVSGKKIWWKYPDGGDFQKGMTASRSSGRIVSANLAIRIVKVDTDEPKKVFIENMDYADLEAFQEMLKEVDPGSDEKVSLTCQNCGEEFMNELPLDSANFFKRSAKKTTTFSK